MKLGLPIFICVLLASCFSEGDCLVSATNLVHIQFKKKSNHTKDTAVILNYISIVGTKYGQTKQQVTELLLPLDINNDSTSTTFAYQITSLDSSVYSYDTIKIGYTRQSKLIAKDCGAYTFYQNLKILKKSKSLDSLQIKVYSTSLLKDPTGSGNSAYAVNYQIYY